MEPYSDHHEGDVVGFGLVSDAARVSGNGKTVVMESDERISKVLENGGNDMRLNGKVSETGSVDNGNVRTSLNDLHAINLVVDLSQCSTKEASDYDFTEKDLPMDSFKPAKIIQCVQDLAQDPLGLTKTEVLTMEGQLSSFNHWKGYYQLHINEILDGLDKNFDYVNSDDITKNSKLNDRSRKHKGVFDGEVGPTKKVKYLSDLISEGSPSLSDVEYTPKKRGRKRKNLELNRDEFLSLVRHSARNPVEKQNYLESLVKYTSNFRNYRIETRSQLMEKVEIQPEVTEENGFTGIKDSYWTDRIIEFKPDEQKTKKENSATALILKFTNLESVPSVKKLNEIFGRYGTLIEHETQVLKKKKCVKMVFEKKCDAESAFSSSGKFSIFGTNLVSYCLNFSPTPRKKATAGRNLSKKGVKSVKGMLFED